MVFLDPLHPEQCNDTIVYCQRALRDECLDHQLYKINVFKLDPDKVVKFGAFCKQR